MQYKKSKQSLTFIFLGQFLVTDTENVVESWKGDSHIFEMSPYLG